MAKIGVRELISFKGVQYPKSVILYAVYFDVRFGVSYHDLEEIMAEHGDEAAATAFFAKAIACNGWRDKVVIDESGSNAAGLFNMNCLLLMNSWCGLIDVLQGKYLNNIIERDHRFVKKITRPMQPSNRSIQQLPLWRASRSLK